MTESISGFEATNENLYEIMWGVRKQLCAQILAEVKEIQDALTVFRQADSSYIWAVDGMAVKNEQDGSIRNLYSGEVKVIPRSPEEAQKLFAIAEEANKKQIDSILAQIDDETGVIVELGAGYGGNLIRLDKAFKEAHGRSLSERGIKLIMAEFTESGRSLCAEFLKCKNAPHMELHHIDHRAPDLSFLNGAENPLIFTVHSIEQVKEIPQDYFEKLSQTGERVRGLHLEPVGFQFEPDEPKWKAHAAFIEEKAYNQNFASVVRHAKRNGHIVIDQIDTSFAAGQPENPSTMVTWHSANG